MVLADDRAGWILNSPAVRIRPRPRGTSQSGQAAREIGDVFKQSRYYDDAEPLAGHVWRHVSPYLNECEFSVVVDLAAGHGRNSANLLPLSQQLYIVDINVENIDHCRERFGDDPRIRYVVNDGTSLAGIPADAVTLVFSFDAMVHFDQDTVRAYLHDFRRVLRPGGRGFCHHSNYAANPGGNWRQNPCWRNFMSRELFCSYAQEAGLRILRSDPIDWGGVPALDCYTLFERPPS